jgi:dynein heavy chain
MVDVEHEKVKTNELIEIVGEESNIAEKEEAIAKKQEEETNLVANDAKEAKANAEKELEAAIPAMQRAKEAVDCLEVKAIVEFKSFASAPPGTEQVTNACLIMVKGETNKKNLTWPKGQ